MNNILSMIITSPKASRQKGFILLFTIVLISVTVGLSVTMLTTTNRQAQLGSLQSETQSAFYAADSGINCALERIYSDIVPAPDFNCGGMTPPNLASNPLKEVYFYDFQLVAFGAGGLSPSCGVVVITDESADPVEPKYVIESYGYNICDIGTTPGVLVPDTTNPNLIERKILVNIPIINIV